MFIEALGQGEVWYDQLVRSGSYAAQYQSPEEVTAEINRARIKIRSVAHPLMKPAEDDAFVLGVHYGKARKIREVGGIRNLYQEQHFWWLNWPDEQYWYNPFVEFPQRTYAIGDTAGPEVVVHDFGPDLGADDMTALTEAYEWFAARTRRRIFNWAPHMVIGPHLAPLEDRPLKTFSWIAGNYSRKDDGLISLNEMIFFDGRINVDGRYGALAGRGISMVDIITTHELAHAVMRGCPFSESEFEKVGDWRTITYLKGRGRNQISHTIAGIGSEDKGLPPTDYGFRAAAEDFAESVVFYRFAPDLLAPSRRQYLDDLFGGWGQQETPLSMALLPEPLYPHRQIAKRVEAFLLPEGRPTVANQLAAFIIAKTASLKKAVDPLSLNQGD